MSFVGNGIAAFAACALLGSCASVQRSTQSEAFEENFAGADYCELDPVKQQSESVCGLACLESLLSYWELPGTQDELVERHPPGEKSGHSIVELKAIAEQRGLTAFTVSFEQKPLPLLYSQLQKGRPVLLAIRCPLGRYFGDPIPLIEHLDSTVVSASVREERLAGAPIASTRDRKKDHYVVAFGYDRSTKNVLLMDPAYGLVSLSESRLLTFWEEQHHAALVCAR